MNSTRRRLLNLATCVVAGGIAAPTRAQAPTNAPAQRTIRVGTASSIADLVRSVAAVLEKRRPGLTIQVISGASDSVAVQMLTGGSDFDAVIFADDLPMAKLVFKGKVVRASAKVMAGNQIALISRHKITDLAQLVDDKFKYIALGDPQLVPLGRYGRQGLVMADVWQAVEPKVVFGLNARITFEYFQRGGVDAAVIYRSDTLLKAAKGAHILPLQGRVEYQIAPIVGTKYPNDVAAFIELALSDSTRVALKQLAFDLP
jgi:molybdate transport system substrate-binding protein